MYFQVKNITKTFGGLKAVDNLSFSVAEKEIFSIIGPNGAGKSTVFNCINGLYQPDAGSIQFKGTELIGKRPDQVAQLGVARMFQNLELFSHMTTLDNLMLGRHTAMKSSIFATLGLSFKRSKAAQEEMKHRRKVEEIIDFLELESARDQLVANLPYGKQKLVELGRALALDPDLLLMDEPTANLDGQAAQTVIKSFQQAAERGAVVVVATHDKNLINKTNDVLLINNNAVSIAQSSQYLNSLGRKSSVTKINRGAIA